MTAKYYLQTALINKLQAIIGIGTVGIWNNQFDNEQNERPINYPCVFVSINNIEWEARKINVPSLNIYNQAKADVNIDLHIGFELYDNETVSLSEVDSFIELVKIAIEATNSNEFNNEYFNSLQLNREQESENYNTVKDYTLTYTTLLMQPAYINDNVDINNPIGNITFEIDKENGL